MDTQSTPSPAPTPQPAPVAPLTPVPAPATAPLTPSAPAAAAPISPPTPPQTPKASMSWGPVAGILVLLLLVLLAGGAYYYVAVLQPQLATDKTTLESAPALNTQEELASIDTLEAELNTTSESNLDAEVTNLEQSL